MRNEPKNRSKLMVLAVSMLLVICLPFVFDLKTTTSNGEVRGVPFDWLAVYPNNGFSFKGLGFLADILIWYFVLRLVMNLFNKRKATS